MLRRAFLSGLTALVPLGLFSKPRTAPAAMPVTRHIGDAQFSLWDPERRVYRTFTAGDLRITCCSATWVDGDGKHYEGDLLEFDEANCRWQRAPARIKLAPAARSSSA